MGMTLLLALALVEPSGEWVYVRHPPTIYVAMLDMPGVPHQMETSEVAFAFYFNSYFIAMSWDGPPSRRTAFPYGFIFWEPSFDFGDWTAATGMTRNSSTIDVSGLERTEGCTWNLSPHLARTAAKWPKSLGSWGSGQT